MTGRAVDGTNAILSGRERGQALKPRSGASKTPGLRPASGQNIMGIAVPFLNTGLS
jgi:hypothetical protein